MRFRYDSILRAVASTPWAIDPAKGRAILDFLSLRAAGGLVAADEVREIAAANRKPQPQLAAGKIAVIPVYGVISPRMNMMSSMSGGTSSEKLGMRIDDAAADETIAAIVLDIDSPGGSVQGLVEVVAKIEAAAKKKRVVAVANHLAASAAYWIASVASEIAVTPSGEVGSIGVYTMHTDYSEHDAQEGIKTTLISAGKYKTERNPFEPLSDEAKAVAQGEIDGWYARFVSAVAKGRGVKAADVRNGFGQGRVVNATDALAEGMVDRIATLDEVLASLVAEMPAARGATVRSSRATGNTVAADVRAEDGLPPADTPPESPDDEICPECGEPMDDGTCSSCGYTMNATAGGAAVAPVASPPTSPAPPQAKEHTVPEETTVAHPNGATNAAAESRAAEITALARIAGKDLAWFSEQLASTKSVAQIREELAAGQPAPKPVITVGDDRAAARGFANVGEQLHAIMQAGIPGGRRDPRLAYVNQRIMAGTPSGMNEGVGSEGGFFLQPELLPGVIDPVYADDPILSRVTRIPMSGPMIRYNVVDETSRADGSRWGGIQAYWAAEADTATAKKPKLRQMELNWKKIIGVGYVTDEMIQDAPAAEALLTRAFQAELRFMLASAIFRGTGVGMPLGFLNAGCVAQQAIEGSQTIANTNQSIALNVSKMLARVPGSLWGDVIWLYQQELLPYLMTAVVGTGGAAVPVFLGAGGISGKPYDTILGRPAFASEQCEAVGTPGDLVALVPSQYHMGEAGGPQQMTSAHVRFLYDEMTLRITYRADGAPVWRTTVTPYKGAAARAPFVTLATRS